MTLDLSIIVPAFNEAPRLAEGMRRFETAVAEGAVDVGRTEVLFVDDGSTDGTAAAAEELLAPLPHHRVVRHPVNLGKGAAVRTGVSLARGGYTAYMDADMAIDPRAIPLLLDGLATHDLAIGSRALPDSMVESTYAVRTVMGRLFHLVRIDRFAFDVEILARARRLGLGITEVPVNWRHVPGSTIHPLDDSITMFIDVYRSRLGLLPAPPVPAVGVRDPSARTPSPELDARVRDVIAGTLVGVPVPVV